MISIVIPLYNKEKSIVSTLQSVLDQTYTDFELIVVNDGSTDGSADVVRDFIRANDGMSRANELNEPLSLNDGRIRLITQDNDGVSAARNRGIMEAKGEYVCFLDGDDLWTEDYLDVITTLIRDYPDAGLYSVRYMVVNDIQISHFKQKRSESREIVRGWVSNPWNNKLRLFIGGVCCSRERLIKIGLFDTRMTHGEDYDLCWRLILDGGLVQDSRYCAFYRMDSENRAMHRYPPIDKQISYYMDKYAEARANDAVFRRFFDEQMIYRLYPYLLDKCYAKEALRLARKLDYSQLKWSMHFRMLFPKTYYLLGKRSKF